MITDIPFTFGQIITTWPGNNGFPMACFKSQRPSWVVRVDFILLIPAPLNVRWVQARTVRSPVATSAAGGEPAFRVTLRCPISSAMESTK